MRVLQSVCWFSHMQHQDLENREKLELGLDTRNNGNLSMRLVSEYPLNTLQVGGSAYQNKSHIKCNILSWHS